MIISFQVPYIHCPLIEHVNLSPNGRFVLYMPDCLVLV